MTGIGKFLGRMKLRGNKKTPAASEQETATEYKKSVSVFINFILQEDKENNIILGKRKERYFICFKNKYFSPFFSGWLVLMKGFVNGELSKSTYDDSFKALCSKYTNTKAAGADGKEAEQNKENKPENKSESEADISSATEESEK